MTNLIEWSPKPKKEVPQEIEKLFPNKWVQQRFVELHLTNSKTAEAFINPSLYIPTNPVELPDLEKGAQRIKKALLNKEEIGIWGDFDVDGQTSTILLVQALRILGANPRYHIPNRDKESHGIRLHNLKDFVSVPIKLLITCDTGVSENASIEFANSKDIDVIITDHHSLPELLPNAYAVINPKRLPSEHALNKLAGVGTAYKLMEYVFRLFNIEEEKGRLLDLVALGTIADIAEINPENHFLVQSGLEKLKRSERLLLKEIFIIKEINPDLLNETHISFSIAPLLNALGRLDDANSVVEHFLTDDLQKARIFANILENLNEKRKLITEQITEAALAILQRDELEQNQEAIVLHHSDWHPGVLGIVASQLVEIFKKPTILLSGFQDQVIRGSARSVDGINIFEAIRESSQMLTQYGGHAMAAGISLRYDALALFKKEFNKSIQKQIQNKKISQEILVDGFLELDQLNIDFVNQLNILAPFGPGNPPFIFATRNISINKSTTFGKARNHIRFKVSDSTNISLDLLWWKGANKSIPESMVDIIYRPGKNSYKGKDELQIEVIEMQPSEEVLEELQSASQKLEIIDLRSEDFNLQALLNNYQDLVIWAEGLSENKRYRYETRINLHPSNALLIYSCPPSLVDIAKAWKIVNPKILVLGKMMPEMDSMNSLLMSISGMINLAVNRRAGVFDIHKAAAATGHRVKTINTVLRYLCSKGKISIKEHPDTELTISFGGIENVNQASQYENYLRFLIQETISFRKWYQKVDTSRLMSEIYELFSIDKK
ncbi:MAG: single-stranded-DNA-specific exonuclease RecJ [Chloroflexi bacterium HGW-Chloroflexi-8]|nr:MAG: single-stranded-DNA-specific exonuclease RecJ [Chloroflexi bacterium HGW-Chloroflexi-8]